MYARSHEDRELTFDFGEGLIENNLLVVDRETRSVWSQLAGHAISGPLEGSPLVAIPSIQTTWRLWRSLHPDTEVAIVGGQQGQPYLYGNSEPSGPTLRGRPKKHDVSELGLGLALGEQAWFFPFAELDRTEVPLHLEIASRTVIIHYRSKDLTAWAEGDDGELLIGVLAYRSGWSSFHPRSSIWTAD